MTAIAAALRAPSESAQLFFSKHHHRWELWCTPAVHTAFKTESNAIELAMIASSTALMQACKRGASRAVNLQALQPIALIRSVDHGSWLSHIDTGMRAFSSEQGPGLSSKCSAEVLDRQLVSAVLRSSVGQCCTLACMSCSCRLITSRSVTLARASTRMRRLFRQQQAVCMALQSCSLITPARSSACCNEAWVSSSVLRVCVSLQT